MRDYKNECPLQCRYLRMSGKTMCCKASGKAYSLDTNAFGLPVKCGHCVYKARLETKDSGEQA